MKNLLTILFLICTLSVFSQNDNSNQDGDASRIEALKIAYLTKKLDLSPGEAQKFWPIYNNYASELKQARQDHRRSQNSELDSEEKVLSIRKKYNAEFSRVLSPDKVNNLFRSEKDFGNYVQKELSDRRQLRQSELNRNSLRK
jgi:hypothetical protein